jgi:hypothetical protein
MNTIDKLQKQIRQLERDLADPNGCGSDAERRLVRSLLAQLRAKVCLPHWPERQRFPTRSNRCGLPAAPDSAPSWLLAPVPAATTRASATP